MSLPFAQAQKESGVDYEKAKQKMKEKLCMVNMMYYSTPGCVGETKSLPILDVKTYATCAKPKTEAFMNPTDVVTLYD